MRCLAPWATGRRRRAIMVRACTRACASCCHGKRVHVLVKLSWEVCACAAARFHGVCACTCGGELSWWACAHAAASYLWCASASLCACATQAALVLVHVRWRDVMVSVCACVWKCGSELSWRTCARAVVCVVHPQLDGAPLL